MINIHFQYQPLFSVKVRHNYYPEGTLNDLHLVPTRRTVQLIDKMAMLVKSSENGLDLLLDKSRQELLHQRLLSSNDAESKFSFFLYNKNPYFLNITDIPVDLKGKSFYFSNKEVGEANKGALHKGEFVTGEDLYSIYPPQEIGGNGNQTIDYKIALENGELEENMPISRVQESFQIDTKSLLEGHYKILGNDKELSSFINIGHQLKGAPLGFVEIFLTKKLKNKILEAIEEDGIRTYNYTIDFDSRAVYWKYLLVPNYNKRAKDLDIVCKKEKDEVLFKKIGEEEVGSRKVLSFISEVPLKYKKLHEYEIQLKRKGGQEVGKTIIKKMPYAPFDLIKPMGQDYMSEIYVYI